MSTRILTDLATYLQDQGLTTTGTDLFLSLMPDTPVTAVALLEVGGPGPQLGLGGAKLFDRQDVQIQVRGETQAAGRTLVDAIYDAFVTAFGVTLGESHYIQAAPISPPGIVARDSEGHLIWSLNLSCWRRL